MTRTHTAEQTLIAAADQTAGHDVMGQLVYKMYKQVQELHSTLEENWISK